MKKKCKVVALPTKEVTQLVRDKETEDYFIPTPEFIFNHFYNYIYLYIVSDDDINIKDYVHCQNFLSDDFIDLVIDKKTLHIVNKVDDKITFKKVIATTEPSLNLPLIPDCFCWEYCRESGINEVMVEILGYMASVSLVKQSWNREEVEALCRKAYSAGWIEPFNDSEKQYSDLENEFINNNL